MAATANEQYLLELINDARMDPLGDAARYVSSYAPLTSQKANIQSAFGFFGVSGPQLLAAYQALVPVAPLAWNDALSVAAHGHNQAMIAADQQSHQLPGEAGLGQRLSNAGYQYTTGGENIYAYSDDVLYGHAGFMVDWGGTAATGGMQSPAGHRVNLMNAALREAGVAVDAESNPATAVGPQVITEDLGSRGTAGALLLGVTYGDTDHDGFYSVGEGRAGLSVGVGGASAVSGVAGGYSVQAGALGAQTVVLSGAGLAGSVSVATTLVNGENAKLDVVDGATLLTSVSGTVSGAVSAVRVLGVAGLAVALGDGVGRTLAGGKGADTLTGGSGDDTILGGAGDDVIDGGAGRNVLDGGTGDNTAVFQFASTAAVVTTVAGVVSVDAGGVHDVVANFQHFRFSDVTAGSLTTLSTHDVHFTDAVTGGVGSAATTAYSGPVAGLQHQYIWSGGDAVAVAAGAPNTFLKGGAGGDALQVAGGSNVLDGGGGSNFLIGGTGADGGADTFFVDSRGGVETWSTIVNFHLGDYATVFGFHAGLSTRGVVASDGAAGYTGYTIHSEIDGAGTGIKGSMTFAGVDQATAAAHFEFTTGTLAGNIDYLLIHYV